VDVEQNKTDKPETLLSKAAKAQEDDKMADAGAAAVTEMLFVLLPFLVSAIVLIVRGNLTSFFFRSEWSLVAAVLMGQAIAKFINLTAGRQVHRHRLVLIVTIMIVVGLVPPLVLHALTSAGEVTAGIAITQVTFFLLSLVTLMAVAAQDVVYGGILIRFR
jgi:hypothetical protein